MVRKLVKKLSACVLAAAVVASLTGCGSVTSGKRIVRISHAQSETQIPQVFREEVNFLTLH